MRFSNDSVLLPGLPYAYFTPDLNFVTSITLRASSPPFGLELTRYYFQAQVDHLKEELVDVAKLGQGAAEEWQKGLDTTGRQKMDDAKRFEHWEATGGLHGLLRSKVTSSLPTKPPPPALSSIPPYIQGQASSAGSRTQSPLSAQHRPSPPALHLLSDCRSLPSVLRTYQNIVIKANKAQSILRVFP